MSEESGAEKDRRGLTRRNFVAASALAGSAALVGAPVVAPQEARAQTAKTTGGRYATRTGAVCTPIPNRYDEPFEVCDDEIFIIIANYKPAENPGFVDKVIGRKLAQKFPHFKFKITTWDYPVRYEEIEAAGVVPDIIIDDPRRRIDRDLEHRGWLRDLTGEIDLSGLNPAAVELVKSRSDGGVYGVPLFIDDFVLLYNKKIFDLFGVRYPSHGMTYDKAYRLAQRLTREQDLVAYKGYLQHPDNYLDFNQLGLYPFLPTGTETPAPQDVKVNITSAGWQKLGANMERFYLIQRNIFTSVDDFLLTGHVAMAVDTLWKMNAYTLNPSYVPEGDLEDWRVLAQNIELGVTSVPVLGGGDNSTYQPNTLAAFLPPQSAKRAQALEVVKWLASEEAQIELAKHGMKPARQSDTVVAAFGAETPELDGIDTSGIFWGENAVVDGYEKTEYWDIPLYRVFRQHVLKDGLSVKSALTVTETRDIPNYIKAQAAAGLDW
ncbi:extracellular solute-binding protein [Streptomyces sp. FIT100]|uniref:extracellular solute-binding protein n=1 Tax=Streptomyces sp. FIT100 TaxID=2837956 RepID=UPI0021C73DA3|nr:extracellular solute-binding protein [Streptomyces sp. FIT100]UUN30725.1 extracellular solute-binding protein [Streptomyces sp. FIT100]